MIWIIDDDQEELDRIEGILKEQLIGSYEIKKILSGIEAHEIVEQKKEIPDILLIDYDMPEKNGIKTLETLREDGVKAPAILLTNYKNFDTDVAMRAVNAGVLTCLPKDFPPWELLFNIRVAEKIGGLGRENRNLLYGIVGNSHKLEEVMKQVERVANSDAKVLLLGDTGTGKTLIAEAIHKMSLRNKNPFVPVNIVSLHENIIESELFGYVKGAFTEAKHDREGRFEIADGGTLFLDEIGEIPLNIQVKLLDFLDSGTFSRMGESEIRKSDVRLISATNKDMERSIKDGTFRDDLFHRINTFPIYIPPLRERKEDIPLLARHYLSKHCSNRKPICDFSKRALQKLVDYDWPGNIRELGAIVEKAVIMCVGIEITESDISFDSRSGKHKDKVYADGISVTDDEIRIPLIPELPKIPEIKDQIVERLIKESLKRYDTKEKAAKAIGITPHGLIKSCKRLKIETAKL